MTGEGQVALGRRQEAGATRPGAMQAAIALGKTREVKCRRVLFLPSAECHLPTGFTLLELMIVITVIIILAAVALPQYQKTILSTREAVLRDDLFNLRKLLDQYAADKQKLPEDLSSLVSDGYMREIPIDPITGKDDWQRVMGDDPNSSSASQGVVDVHSSSPEMSLDGTPYSDW